VWSTAQERRGQAKSTKTKLMFSMPPKTIGIDRNSFKEPPGQMSVHFIEPFSFKLPFKESVALKLAEPLKKILKNNAIAFFSEERKQSQSLVDFFIELIFPIENLEFYSRCVQNAPWSALGENNNCCMGRLLSKNKMIFANH